MFPFFHFLSLAQKRIFLYYIFLGFFWQTETTFWKKKGKESYVFHEKKGKTEIRDGRIRTYDFLLPKQTRYQAALHPVYKNYKIDGNRSSKFSSSKKKQLQESFIFVRLGVEKRSELNEVIIIEKTKR